MPEYYMLLKCMVNITHVVPVLSKFFVSEEKFYELLYLVSPTS